MPFYLPVERFDRKTKTKRSERGPPMIILALTDPGLGVGQDLELQFKVASLSKTTSCFYNRRNPLGVRTNFNTNKNLYMFKRRLFRLPNRFDEQTRTRYLIFIFEFHYLMFFSF